jgi:hypothetical protein
MRNLLALAAALALAFAGIGWYRGWYKVETEPAAGGHQSVNIDFNRDKIVEDSENGVKKVEAKLQKVLDRKQQDDLTGNDDKKANIKGAVSLSPPKLIIQQEKDSSNPPGPDLP